MTGVMSQRLKTSVSGWDADTLQKYSDIAMIPELEEIT